MKKAMLIICIFTFLSILYINDPKEKIQRGERSIYLSMKSITDDDSEQVMFINEKGEITFANDKGYAIKVLTSNKKKKLEQYYDENREPICMNGGYYALLREYDEWGRDVLDTYLGIDQEPVNNTEGYSKIRREYNKAGSSIKETYINTKGELVCSTIYGYSKVIEYNEYGQAIKVTYMDEHGNPMITNLGFAIETRTYYKSEDITNGKVKEIYYYDNNNKPIAQSLGQYGVYKEYDRNGQEYRLTYLDANGSPIITNKGFSTIETRYINHSSNSIMELYYDTKGKPISLSEGQYGVLKKNGAVIYLDINGKEIFNIKRILYNTSWITIPIVYIIILLSILSNKKWNIFLLFIYFFTIVYFTLLYREQELNREIGFFRQFSRVFIDRRVIADIIKNVWLFIPLGAILYSICQKAWILLIPIIMSGFIEGIQYYFGLGICEFDDIISNCCGGYIGFAITKISSRVLRTQEKKEYEKKQ